MVNKNDEDVFDVALFARQLSDKEILQNCAFPEAPIGLLQSQRPVRGHMLISKPIISKKQNQKKVGITMIDLE